jgi:hypothetical protein
MALWRRFVGFFSTQQRTTRKVRYMKTIIPKVSALLLAMAAIVSASPTTSAQAQPPPIKLECTFHRVDFTKQMIDLGFSKTKVAPTDIAWLLPGGDPMHINFTYAEAGQRAVLKSPGTDFGRGLQGTVLGTGRGQLTASTDRRKLCIQLAKLASDQGANAINYQISKKGTLSVQFLRIRDDILQKVGRRQNPAQ